MFPELSGGLKALELELGRSIEGFDVKFVSTVNILHIFFLYSMGIMQIRRGSAHLGNDGGLCAHRLLDLVGLLQLGHVLLSSQQQVAMRLVFHTRHVEEFLFCLMKRKYK
jgi:hypothetical protein